MPHTAVVHARIDPATKAAGESVLDTLGMTPTEAIRLFYRQIAMRRDFRIPNKLTASVLNKSDKNQEIEEFKNGDELFVSWEK